MWSPLSTLDSEVFSPLIGDDKGRDMAPAPGEEVLRDLDPASLEHRLPLYLRLQGLRTRVDHLVRRSPDNQRLGVYLSVAQRAASLKWLRVQETQTLEFVADYLERGLQRAGD